MNPSPLWMQKFRVSLRSEINSIQQNSVSQPFTTTHDQEEALSISDRVVVMYNGQMEQVGTPFEIYNFPATEFVASFVGTLNAVEAEVIDPKTNTLRVDGIQLQAAKGFEGKNSGDKLTIAIRPERFNFASEQKKANVFDALIENITFLGSIVRIQVVVGSIKFYMDTFNNPFLNSLRSVIKPRLPVRVSGVGLNSLNRILTEAISNTRKPDRLEACQVFVYSAFFRPPPSLQ